MTDSRTSYLRYLQFGLTPQDIEEAISSACDFFDIPMPNEVYDLTYVQDGETMFLNYDPESYEDDVLCFNLHQLRDLNVDTKEAFSLIMTHECAHRVLQDTRFPGINDGAWEHELAADFLMGCRAGLWDMDDSRVRVGLLLTGSSPTHPDGALRALFIRHGMYIAREMQYHGIPLTLQNLLNEFMKFRKENLQMIYKYQQQCYGF